MLRNTTENIAAEIAFGADPPRATASIAAAKLQLHHATEKKSLGNQSLKGGAGLGWEPHSTAREGPPIGVADIGRSQVCLPIRQRIVLLSRLWQTLDPKSKTL